MPVTFVAAVNDRSLLQNNLLASPCLQETSGHQFLFQQGYASASDAYNQAIDRSDNDLLIFVHQDMYLPSGWLTRVSDCLKQLQQTDPNWGVVGCWGTAQTGEGFGHVYTPGLGVIGSKYEGGEQVQTLDEIVLIMRKSRGLRFEAALPHFHFYGTALCLRARERGMRSYAISAFCIHNSKYLHILPPEFYECYTYVKRVWRDCLPIQTSCIRITHADLELRKRRMKEWAQQLFGSAPASTRVDSPSELYRQCKTSAM